MQTKLDRLRARGTVRIEADAGGYHVSWWPKGQRGNPFCGRGESGPALDPIVADLEEATRPPSRDWDGARFARERQARLEAEQTQRARMRGYDIDDRLRERRDRRWQEAQIRRSRARRAASI